MAPRPSTALLQENESFWAGIDQTSLKPLAAALLPEPRAASMSWIDRLARRAYLNKMPNQDATVLGSFYSRALDYWGVRAQEAGKPAAGHFQRALDLNPANVAAQINLDYSKSLQANKKAARLGEGPGEEILAEFRKWDRLLGQNGPFAEPAYCYQQGLEFAKGRLYRQAAQNFARAKSLLPEDMAPSLWLARMDILRALPDEALGVMQDIHEHATTLELTRTNLADLLLVETSAYLTKHNVKGAEATVQWVMDKYPEDSVLLATAARVYLGYGVFSNAVTCIKAAVAKRPDNENLLVLASQVYMCAKMYGDALSAIEAAMNRHSDDDISKQFMLATAAQIHINAGSFSNAVACIDRQLALDPNNPEALIYKGYACLQLGALDQAASTLTRAMEMETNNTPKLRASARLNRAVTYLRADKLDLARRDYETLRKSLPSLYPVYYGLQEIAYRERDTNAAVRYCQLYLTNAPPNTPEAKQIRDRLKELQLSPH
jgi:Flp pilus assembly protein TadD